jgi:twitching motility protein PilT
LRDLETISAALTAAETGHLVMASLHTVSASQTIERIVDVFDSHRQPQVRLQLANTLRVIICQTLLRNRRDGGMVPACEVLVNNTAVAAAIRENKVHLINGMIETGSSHAMQLLDAALASLVAEGLVTREDALSRAADIKRLERLLERRGPAETAGRAAKNKKPWE